MSPIEATTAKSSWLTEDPPEDTYHDLLCTGLVDHSRHILDPPDMQPCNNGEYILQGTDSGEFRAICAYCHKEYELPSATWRIKPEAVDISEEFHIDATPPKDVFKPALADGDDSE